ncbi:MAG: TatD family hydrolase [Gemmatimonadaceae bacterium]|jgi:TatD DNase family protein|nr:TatD family hydrolase [Gemmatimonadaceae bacterium]
MSGFIDSHVHLADPQFEADRDAVIARAREAGAAGLVCIGESIARAHAARAIAEAYPGFVWWTAGVHPHDAADYVAERDEPAIRDCLAAGAVAVGECGLDYHYDHSPRPRQRQVFASQLALAAEAGRAVVVHSREAAEDTIAMVREAGAAGIRGVLHCHTGPAALAEAALDVGWCVSFAGVITFRTWNDPGLLRMVPDDRLLVETDAPYLAPVPYRGTRNEPHHVPRTLDVLAQVRGTTAGHLETVTADTARRLFALAG